MQGIHFAVLNRSTEALLECLSADPTLVNLADMGRGWQPLHWAADGGDVEIAELLLAHGAKLDGLSMHEQSPLHVAVISGAVNVCELLVSRGAQCNARDSIGAVPLDYALCTPSDEGRQCADILQKAGTLPTLLSAIYRVDDRSIERILLNRDRSWDRWGHCAHMVADVVTAWKCEAVDELRHGVSYENAMNTVLTRHLRLLDIAITAGADVNSTGILARGRPIIRALDESGIGLGLLRALVERGADIHYRDDSGRGCLDYALQTDNTVAAEYLAARGAIAYGGFGSTR